MFGFRKQPPEKPSAAPTNPFDSDPTNPFDSEPEPEHRNSKNAAAKPSRITSSEPTLPMPNEDDDDDDYFGRGPTSLSAYKQKKGVESMSMQELEGYAVNQAQETTKSVNNCLKIAVDIREDASRTLDTLHQQGEQIHRTHVMAADMERDLSKGEKLLNNLGGMFSMPWKPKKTRAITGPKTSKDDNDRGKRSNQDEREKLGLTGAKGKGSRTPPPEPTNAMQHIEFEKAKQDDALSDLGDILGELKGMAVDMGSELDRQNKALDHLQDDVDELNSRVKGANQRARRLVGK